MSLNSTAVLRPQGEGRWISIGLRMHAGQLTWVGLSASPSPPTTPAQLLNATAAVAHTSVGVELQLAAFLSELVERVPGVHLPAAAVGNGEAPRGEGDGGGAAATTGKRRPDALGVWVQAGALNAALKVLVAHLGKLL